MACWYEPSGRFPSKLHIKRWLTSKYIQKTTTMDRVHELMESTFNFAQTSTDLGKLYDRKYNASSKIGAIVFDNLRVDFASLEDQLLHANSTNEKLICVLNAFQNAIITLKDFMGAAYSETDPNTHELKDAIESLFRRLKNTLYVIDVMKVELNDNTLAISKYTRQLENDMTERVQSYLHQSSLTTMVFVVRNYALHLEVLYCAESLMAYLQKICQ